MKKMMIFVLGLAMAFTTIGCAKKTASEQLQADMKEAGDAMKKEAKAWQ